MKKYRIVVVQATPFQGLRPNHIAQLRASGISPEVALQRGYKSITRESDLRKAGFAKFQANTPGLLIPIHHVPGLQDIEGKPRTRFQYRPDSPRTNEDGRAVKYETPKGTRLCIDVPPQVVPSLGDPSIPLVVTEGAKKADAAVSAGLACVALLGVQSWDLDDWKQIELSHRRVYICFDSDVMQKREVASAMKKLAHFLHAKGATVQRLYLPSTDEHKVGLDDYLAMGHSTEELLACTKRPRFDAEIRDDLPIIEIHKHDLETLTELSIKALVDENDPPVFFNSLGRLVQIRTDEIRGRKLPRIEPVSKDMVIDRLSQVANYITVNTSGRRPNNPPDLVAKVIHSRHDWPGIPPIRRVTSGPVFTKDGEPCGEPGYNSKGQVFVCIPAGIRTPAPVDSRSLKDAVACFYDLLCDFPFEDDASKAHCLAFTLLPFVRDMIDGPTPLHLFDAPKPGTGKTKLMAICASLFSAESAFLENAPDSEDEWRKRLTATFLEGHSHVLLDDVKTLKSNSLLSALSNPLGLWKDRQLSRNENVRAEIRVTWGVAGNNLSGTAELLRRCVRIRLNAQMERPETRDFFKHPYLEQYVKNNHIKITKSLLSIVQYWIEHGKPLYQGKNRLGGFESWVQVMGGILDSASVPGFLSNQGALMTQADEESAAFHGFFQDWYREYASRWVGAKDVLKLARHHFEEFSLGSADSSSKVKLGKFLAKQRDNIHGNLMLVMKHGHDGNLFKLRDISGQ